MADTSRSPSHHEHLIAAAVGLLALSVYLLTASFSFHSIDEIAVFAVGRSLAARGSFDGDVLFWTRDALGRGSIVADGVNGTTYVVKDVAPAMLITPLIGLAHAAGMSPIRTSLLYGPVITALTAALLYHVSRAWGFRRQSATIAALTFAFASLAWPFAETLFTQSLAGLGLLIALHGTIRACEGHGWQAAMLGGMGLGLAGLSAVPTWVSLPVYILYMLVPSDQIRPLERVRHLLAFGAGVGLFAMLQAGYNWLRFGALLETGYQQVGASSIHPSYLLTGLFGQLLSTPRGVIWYAPLILLLPFGAWIGFRAEHRPRYLLASAQALIILLLYSSYATWWAGVSWGPRFLVAIMPAVSLLLLPLWDRLSRTRITVSHALAALVWLISFLTQIAAVLFDYLETEAPISERLMQITPPAPGSIRAPILTSPDALPWPRQWASIQHGSWDVFWMREGQPDGLILTLALALIALTAFALWRLLAEPPHPAARAMLAASAVMVAGFTAFILIRYSHNPYASPGLEAAVTSLSPQLSEQDVVLALLPVSYLDWIGSFDGSVRDIGVMMEDPLSERTAAKLDAVSQQHTRVWLISEGTVGGNPANGVEGWLAQRGHIGAETWVEGFRFVPYTFSRGAEPPPIGQTFGEGVVQLEYGSAGLAYLDTQPAWVNVDLIWRASQPVSQSLTVFAHLLNADGMLVAQHDGLPAAGYAPTTAWHPGQLIEDRRSLLLPADLPAGDYRLMVGLYDPATGARLTLPDGSDALLLDTLHID